MRAVEIFYRKLEIKNNEYKDFLQRSGGNNGILKKICDYWRQDNDFYTRFETERWNLNNKILVYRAKSNKLGKFSSNFLHFIQ